MPISSPSLVGPLPARLAAMPQFSAAPQHPMRTASGDYFGKSSPSPTHAKNGLSLIQAAMLALSLFAVFPRPQLALASPAATALRQEEPPVIKEVATFPIENGQYRLRALMNLFGFDESTQLPSTSANASNRTLGKLFADQNINPDDVVLTVDSEETVTDRLARWGFASGPISVDTPDSFRKLTLASLETFFRLNADHLPSNPSTLSESDKFANAVTRYIFAHDRYNDSDTLGKTAPVADGSVLFETAFAPVETVNDDLLRNKDTLRYHLAMIQLEQVEGDGVLTGKPLRVLATEFTDQALGTNIAPRVRELSPARKAVINRGVLTTQGASPFTDAGYNVLAQKSGLSVKDFAAVQLVTHTWASNSGGISRDSRSIQRFWNDSALNDALGDTQPPRSSFGFVDWLIAQAVPTAKTALTQLRADMDADFSADPVTAALIGSNGQGDSDGLIHKLAIEDFMTERVFFPFIGNGTHN